MSGIQTTVSALCLAIAFATAAVAGTTTGDTAALEKQRSVFKDARKALSRGDTKRFLSLQKQLAGYPLHSYLEFESLLNKLQRKKPGLSDIRALNLFEQKFADQGLTRKLTRALQRRFVQAENWPLFLGLSKSRVAADMPCATVRARFETGKLKKFDDQALALWTQPAKPSTVCANVLTQLEAKKLPSIKAIWERIFAAMEADRPAYAKSLLPYLGKRDRKRVKQWLAAIKSPEKYLNSGSIDSDTILNRRVLVDLVLAWSKTAPVAAMNYWMKVNDRYTFYSDRHYDTHRLLAMRGAYRRLPEAYDWLNSVPGRDDDLELKEWRVRAALFKQDWLQVIKSIKRLPREEQEEDHWAYWEARALEQAGHTNLANTLYARLAELPTYHGFLSADKLHLDYAIADVPLDADRELVEQLAKRPAIVRAREYHRVGLPWEGRREWNHAIDKATSDELAAGAELAVSWGLHDRAIFNAGRAERKQALAARFPVVYRTQVASAARENELNPAWVFGVMRRESAYIPDVKSSAGAVGLMQLMPNTAKYVARLQGDKNWRGDLTDVATNIGFGTYYLRHVLNKFDDHIVLATASYNAGPKRIRSWLPERDMDADVWIDAIPYSETRRYVRAVLAYTAIYEWHLTRQPARLSSKLLIIPAATGT